MENHVKKGIFIRHTATSSHIYYWDTGTYPVNNYKHVWFDEGINDLEIQNPKSKFHTAVDFLVQATVRGSGRGTNHHSTKHRLSTRTIHHYT